MNDKYIWSERSEVFDPNMYIRFFFKIGGNPEHKKVAEAVKKAFAANETTMSKIVFGDNGKVFYEKLPESGCSVTCCDKSIEELCSMVGKELLKIDKGELMRVYITGQKETSVYIIAHHLAGDGKSIIYFIGDMMRALAGETLGFTPIKLLGPDSFPKNSRLPVFYKWLVSRENRKWRKDPRVFSAEDYYILHKKYWANRGSQLLKQHFSPEETEAIHQKAKAAGVSVNTFIATAFLEAGGNQHSIGLAVGARDDGNRSMSNQVSGINADYTYNTSISFAENAKKIHSKITKKLNKPFNKYFILQFVPLIEPTLFDSVLFYVNGLYDNDVTTKISKLMAYGDKKLNDIGITNLTKIDIPTDYNGFTVENITFIPPVTSYSGRVVGVLTSTDGMNIVEPTFYKNSDGFDRNEIEFFDRACQRLLDFCENK